MNELKDNGIYISIKIILNNMQISIFISIPQKFSSELILYYHV